MSKLDDAAQKMIANLEANTGKSLDHWIGVVNQSGLTKHTHILKMLKSDHGFTHGFANMVALKAKEARETAAAGGEIDLVANQYSGAKSDLKPIYEKIMAEVEGFGSDIEVAPKKNYVSLRRNKQFAIVQPSTKTRVDVGLNLNDVEPDGRLEKSGSFNSMVSHRVRLEDAGQVDDELIAWLRQAYENA